MDSYFDLSVPYVSTQKGVCLFDFVLVLVLVFVYVWVYVLVLNFQLLFPPTCSYQSLHTSPFFRRLYLQAKPNIKYMVHDHYVLIFRLNIVLM